MFDLFILLGWISLFCGTAYNQCAAKMPLAGKRLFVWMWRKTNKFYYRKISEKENKLSSEYKWKLSWKSHE